MEFLVADAERMFAENGKLKHLSFWSYKIMTRSHLQSYQNPPLFPSTSQSENYIVGNGYVDYCTWHRYSDFEWLVQRLEEEFPGLLFPPLPGKEADGTVDKIADLMRSEKESEEVNKHHPLVKKRIRRLQLALNVVSQLSEVHESTLFKAFVTMDDAGWCTFREQTPAKAQPKAWSAVKSTGWNVLAKLKVIKDTQEPVFPVGSAVDTINTEQIAIGNLLGTCSTQLENIVRISTAEYTNLSNNEENVNRAQAQELPETLCFNGHLVRDAEHPEVEGVVRHFDGNIAWVEWNTAKGKLVEVNPSNLLYPTSGVADPAVFVCQELTLQVESYIIYLHLRPETVLLRDLLDLIWFLQQYTTVIASAIDNLQKICREAQNLRKSVEKSKGKQEQMDRLKQLEDSFSAGTARLTHQYKEVYRLHQKKIFLEISRSYGSLSSVLMNDEEWEQRLWRADAALPLLFDAPSEALKGGKEEDNGRSQKGMPDIRESDTHTDPFKSRSALTIDKDDDNAQSPPTKTPNAWAPKANTESAPAPSSEPAKTMTQKPVTPPASSVPTATGQPSPRTASPKKAPPHSQDDTVPPATPDKSGSEDESHVHTDGNGSGGSPKLTTAQEEADSKRAMSSEPPPVNEQD